MFITKNNALRIVKELQDIINQNINFIDNSGIIIASTDKSRTGQFHEAAYQLVKDNLTELVINFDNEYEGSKKGINLPIKLNNEIIGVIGITGEHNDVVKYGQIIKKITEIMIYDFYIKEQVFLEERMKEQFVHELLLGNIKNDDPVLEEKAKILGINLKIPRIVVVAKCIDMSTNQDKSFGLNNEDNLVLRFLKNETINHKENIIISLGDKYILYLVSDNTSFIKSEAIQKIKKFKKTTDMAMVCGIGRVCYVYSDARISYKEAVNALNVSTSEYPIRCYDEMDIELIFGEISQKTKNEFIDKIFKKCSSAEINDFIKILDVYFKNNGSINKSAGELFIHKNTMQYRLLKIARKTGYDPRVPKESAVLFCACSLKNLIY